MRKRFGVLKITAFLSVTLGILLFGELTQAMAESWLQNEEKAMTSHVNAHRHGHGLRPLSMNAGLQMIARRQAQRMVMAGKIKHNPNLMQEADEAIPDWLLLGENVGVGPSEEEVEDAFLDSPAHHSNIDEKDYNIVGVGGMAAEDGEMYFTQNFAQVGHTSAKPAKKTTAKKKKKTPTPPTKPSPVRTKRVPPLIEVKGKRVTAHPRSTVSAEPSPEPSVSPTAVSSPAPSSSPPAAPAPKGNDVNLINSIGALLGEAVRKIGSAFAKLAFWRH